MNIRTALFILFIILALLLASCAAAPAIFADPTPTVMPTPTLDPFEAAKIVEAFWAALESGDLDAAMVYVADDASCAGYCYFTGRTAFQSYLHGYLEAGHVTKISDVKNVGGIVTYSWAVYRNGNFVQGGDGNEVMQIENGKIIYWENQHR